MDANYKKFLEGLDQMGAALIDLQEADNKPLKLLVSKLVGKLGFNDPSVGDDIAMIRFAIENDDESLEKLTAQVAGNGDDDDKGGKDETDGAMS